AYVARLGKSIAAKTERPNLPWEFRVVDDPTVNAFALPGGFIFVTRGLMGTVNNEAELATVLGHEIGHVTARHSAQQISRAQVAQLGLGVGSVLSSTFRKYGQAAGAGLGLLFLKFSRDDEAQADQLGFRYALNENYDVREMSNVFQTLQRVSQVAGGGRVPEWQATHPDPVNRIKATEDRLAALPPGRLNGAIVDRDGYLHRLDGMVYGQNPRQGFFRGSLFLHPDLKFQFQFPDGWKTENQSQAVVGVSPGRDAILQVSLAGQEPPGQAAQKFFAQQGIQAGNRQRTDINGASAVIGTFQAQTDQGNLEGIVAFLAHGGSTYQLLGYTGAGKYPDYSGVFRQALGSFDRLTDPAALNIQPQRIRLQSAPKSMTLEQFNLQYPSAVSVDELALINGVQKTDRLSTGQLVKRVVR
ncbi:MAG: M48 family metalloprotease, partial [Gemmatimonadales bacterium]